LSYFEDGAPHEDEQYSPGQRLLASVLHAAVTDFTRRGSGYFIGKARESARRWIFGTPLPGMGLDFEHVCDELRLDPAQIRRLVQENRVRQLHQRRSRSPQSIEPLSDDREP
jgi:hypothetical protein